MHCNGSASCGASTQSFSTNWLRIQRSSARWCENGAAACGRRAEGNGYVITFGDTRVYIAGDTENIPEMKMLKDIAVAFLPMNLPYTMTPVMVADAARAFRPRILYPYHFGKTDTSELTRLLATEKAIEVRIRKME